MEICNSFMHIYIYVYTWYQIQMHKDLATLRNESEEMHAACEEEVEEEEDHQRQHCTQSKRVFVCPRQK